MRRKEFGFSDFADRTNVHSGIDPRQFSGKVEKKSRLPVAEIGEIVLAVAATVSWGYLAHALFEYRSRSEERRKRHYVSTRLLEQVFPQGL